MLHVLIDDVRNMELKQTDNLAQMFYVQKFPEFSEDSWLKLFCDMKLG